MSDTFVITFNQDGTYNLNWTSSSISTGNTCALYYNNGSSIYITNITSPTAGYVIFNNIIFRTAGTYDVIVTVNSNTLITNMQLTISGNILYTISTHPLTLETPSFNLVWYDNSLLTSEYNLYFIQGQTENLIQEYIYNQDSTKYRIIFSSITFQTQGLFSVRVQKTSGTGYDVTASNSLTITCYCKGTEILCDNDEYIKIENLKIGDKIQTYKNGLKKILFIHKDYFTNDTSYNQIHKLSNIQNQTKELYLTNGHSILVDKLSNDEINKSYKYWNEIKKIEDKYLLLNCVNDNIEKIYNNKIYEIYHLVLESNEEYKQYGIYANGILSESMSINCYNNICKNKLYIR